MPKVLLICAHRPGRSPSQRYRFEQYLSFLEGHGFKFTWSWLLSDKDDRIFYSKGNLPAKFFILVKSKLIRLRDSFRFGKFDIVFIQREANFLGTSFFEKMAYRSGAYVIFDFDDSIWLADTSPGNLRWEWVKKPRKFFSNLKHTHCVIAGNTYLATKAKGYNNNTVLIPTTIDTSIHIPQPEKRGKDVLIIGWSGSISTIKHFELLLPVLKRLSEKYKSKIRFKALGIASYRSGLPDLITAPWTPESEVHHLNTFDIGIMPLPSDEWAMGKCGLKGLSYMACEIPAVLSAVGVNCEIIQHGSNGFLARNEDEWFDLLSGLIENKELRISVGKKGRETVIERYSVEANKSKYLEVFRQRK